MERAWQRFKYVTYLVGYTVILTRVGMHNMDIVRELLYWDSLYALISFEATIMLYPVWLIGVIVIIAEWRKDEQASIEASVRS